MGNLQEELTRTENVALTSEDDVQKQIEHIKVTVISFLLHKKYRFHMKGNQTYFKYNGPELTNLQINANQFCNL